MASKIKPNYALSTEEAYKSALLEHASFVKRLELLDHCDIRDRLSDGPSWVPNWSIVNQTIDLVSLACSASGNSASRFTYRAPGILEVEGLHHSTICNVSASLTNSQDVLSVIQNIELEQLENGRYPTGEPLIDAYICVLNHGKLRDFWDAVPKYPTLEDARQLLLNNVAPGTDPSATKEMLDPDFLAPIYHEQSKGRRFVYTQGGYFGLAPEPTQPGDLVCIILGCALPKVLRKIDPSAALSVPQTSPSSSSPSFFYQVIGQCYIHGLTNAEAFSGLSPPPGQSRDARMDADAGSRSS